MDVAFPDWGRFTTEFVEAELPRLMGAAEREVAAIEKDGADTFEGLVWRLDDATRDLWRCWGDVSHMMSVMNSPEWRRVEEAFQPKIVAFALRDKYGLDDPSHLARFEALEKELMDEHFAAREEARKQLRAHRRTEAAELLTKTFRKQFAKVRDFLRRELETAK